MLSVVCLSTGSTFFYQRLSTSYFCISDMNFIRRRRGNGYNFVEGKETSRKTKTTTSCYVCIVFLTILSAGFAFHWYIVSFSQVTAYIASLGFRSQQESTGIHVHLEPTDAPSIVENDEHNRNLAVLPLQPWEHEAIENLRNGSLECNHPVGVAGTCCPGSFSKGGVVTNALRLHCVQVDYEYVERQSLQFLNTWATDSCDVCRVLEILRQQNLPLVILGDSMTLQAFDGLLCELQRRNYQVMSNVTKTKNFNQGWGKVKAKAVVTIQSTNWPEASVVYIKMFFIYSVPFILAQEANEINKAGGILWFNFGLHDKNGKFLFNMQTFLTSLKMDSNFSLVLFRETSAQHYNIANGMYKIGISLRSKKCTPLEWTDMVGIRDRRVEMAARHAGYDIVPMTNATLRKGTMTMLPFHNFTAALHGSHPYDEKIGGECTHYCTTPFLWMPLWRTLRIAMDTAFQ